MDSKTTDTMILSLPNSGSDWFGPLVAECAVLKYTKEYFSPTCNTRYRQVIEPHFGCEMISCFQNIARGWEDDVDVLDEVFHRTWATEDLQCTKDVFNFRKVGWFVRHFTSVAMVRDAELSFPPKRRRVQVWYEAINEALVGAMPHITLKERVLMAHDAAMFELRANCEKHNVPIIDYRVLMENGQNYLTGYLRNAFHATAIDPELLAAKVCETRVMPSGSRYWG